MIFKMPWSSSGRGICVATKEDESATEKVKGMIRSQGGILADVFYVKVLDFAAEFYVGFDRTVDFIGFSVFQTISKGNYAGNVVDSQEELRMMIADVMHDDSLIDEVVDAHIDTLKSSLAGKYQGFVGIDMMAVNTKDGIMIHPCVEINLRLNMGIVAMEAYRRPFFFDLEEDSGSEEGAVRRSSILEPSEARRERGFHIGLRSRNISIWYS